MGHFKFIVSVIVIALVAIWISNNVGFVGSLTGQK